MRDAIIYFLWKTGDFRLQDISNYFNVGYTGISNARIRGEEYLQKDKHLREKMDKLINDI